MAAKRLQVTPGLQVKLEFRSQAPLGRHNQHRKHRKLVRAFAAAALALSFPAVALGQAGFGQTGTGFGQAGLGQTGFGQATGQTGAGQTGQAGGLGLGDALTSGFGQSGQNGFGANPFSVGGLSGQALSPYGRNGLIGTSSALGGSTGAAGSAGANTGGAVGAANNLGGLTSAALNQRGLQSAFGGPGGRNARGGLNQNQNSTNSKVRATVSLGFEVAPPTNAVATQAINDRLSRIPSSILNGVTVEINGRTATIRGEVNAPSDGKVIERLLSLEPGIDAVDNELTYANGQAPPMPVPATSGTTALEPSVGISAVQVAPEVVPAPDPK
jgi:hypothetical protein